jgi:hypothetical protein
MPLNSPQVQWLQARKARLTLAGFWLTPWYSFPDMLPIRTQERAKSAMQHIPG